MPSTPPAERVGCCEQLFVGGSDRIDGLGPIAAELSQQLLDRLVVSPRNLPGVVGVHVEAGAAALGDFLAAGSLLSPFDQSGIRPFDRGNVGEQLTRIPSLLVHASLKRLLGQSSDRFLELLAVLLQRINQFVAVGDRHEAGHSAPVIPLVSSQRRSAA